jgi:protein O-GlcNAc transferase
VQPATPDSALELARQCFRAGQFTEAERLCHEAIAIQPDHGEALYTLGVLAQRAGRLVEAADLLARAADAASTSAEIRANLGILLAQLDRWDEAIAALRRAIELQSGSAELHYNLGRALVGGGRHADAIAAYRSAIELRPDFAEAHNNLGNAHAVLGEFEQAFTAYRRAIELRHDFAQAYKNLGELLGRRGQLKQAITAYRSALSLRPDYGAAAAGLANALLSNQDLDSAISVCESTLARRPDFRDLYITLGCSYRDAGRTDDAIACYQRALAEQPDPRIHSELLMMFHFHPAYGRRRLFEEHAKWNDTYAGPLISSWRPHANSPIADRPLRIGYVAWHLGNHPLGRLLVPLFANHNRERFEVYCYCEVRDQDAVGDALYHDASVWRTIRGLSDEAVAELVREDRIDILVDLNMHTLGNRLLMFARKPAPVQVTYLAYPSTTGLAAMDYRISDPYLDPPGTDESVYAEKTVRLPNSFWCYPPPPEAPPVNPLPALTKGHIQFGCLNSFAKVNAAVLELWCKLLARVPNSTLLLHCPSEASQLQVLKFFERGGVAPTRIHFSRRMELNEYFARYHEIDIALDPFPYCGGTTTCDALWMGVPVVSLTGDRAVARGGLSILSSIGLSELAVGNSDDYVSTAAALASDFSKLGSLRASLRERMRASPLMLAADYARHLEAAYREIWRARCCGERR